MPAMTSSSGILAAMKSSSGILADDMREDIQEEPGHATHDKERHRRLFEGYIREYDEESTRS